ncbi:MAG: ricin-type beta-trefoil lectin domain protein [Pseudomonadales bacterium]|nr:ricin-type beta-trefoil lectin domain protein [Pseudomonadales bacterium]
MLSRFAALPSIVSLSCVLLLSACSGGSDDRKNIDAVNEENDTATTGTGTDTNTDTTPSDQQRLSNALAAGDVSLLPTDTGPLYARTLDYIDLQKNQSTDFLQTIYGDTLISYTPEKTSQFFMFEQREGVYPLIRGNKGKLLAAAVEIDGQRNAAFGSNILRRFQDDEEVAYEAPMIQLLTWLMTRDSNTQANAAEVRLANMDTNTAASITTWLTDRYPLWNVSHCLDDAMLTACVSESVDLVITGSAGDTAAALVSTSLQTAQSNGTGVMYVHLHSWNSVDLTNTVLAVMNLSMQSPGGPGNYYSQDAASWSNYQEMLAASWDLADMRDLVSKLQDDTFSFDLSSCATSCDATFATEYKDAVNSLRSTLSALDAQNRNIFAEPGYELEKLLILLGDTYRQSIVYPMDVGSGDSKAFLQAYFADFSVYNSRLVNPAQPDLGNFSRSDFSHITPINKTVNLTSKKSFRSAGVYALPGQTFTVTRHDGSDLNVSVFINTQRSASTKEFDENQYKRPKYLQSTAINIAAGETITVTNPYGGPLQLKFDKNDLAVELSFKNVGQHAHWASAADDESFAASLASGDYDWAEVVTANFEVHSQLEKMRLSIANEAWGSASAMAAGTEKYIHNYPHVLAGFQGPGIDVVPEIHDFAAAKGWSLSTQDIVKHMNADQPTCGSGCSGNPYDAGWQFNPIGHGDIHEFGHGLEKGKFRFAGWDSHASTNPYSYYSKSKYHKSTATVSSCQSLPFDAMFETLKQSMLQADPFGFMQSAKLTSWSQGMSIYVQMMMAAQAQGSLEIGWHLLARLHVLEREFAIADNADESWLAKRDSLGFGQFALADAKALNNNDWLLIAISTVTERDYRDFLTMWGLSFTDVALQQVASYGYATMPMKFYQASGRDFCDGLDKSGIDIIDTDGDGILDAFDAFVDDASEWADADGDGQGDNTDETYDLDPATLRYNDVEVSSLSNSLCLAIDASATLLDQKLQTVTCSQDANTLWSWGNDGQLHSKADYAYCVTAASLSSGKELELALCAGNNTQFFVYNVDDKSIKSLVESGVAFDKYSNGSVNLYGVHGGSNQQWQIVE